MHESNLYLELDMPPGCIKRKFDFKTFSSNSSQIPHWFVFKYIKSAASRAA